MNITKIDYDPWISPAVFKDNKPHFKYNERTLPIRYIVLHTTGGTDSRNWLSKWDKINPKSLQNDVSIHYLVQRDGNIYQIIEDEKRAWHVGECLMPGGEKDGNSCAIGIEIEHLNEADFPEQQMNSVAELVHSLTQKYHIDGKYVVSHASVARPGPNIRKVDPVHFDWADLWTRIGKLSAPMTSPDVDPVPSTVNSSYPVSQLPYTAYTKVISLPDINEAKLAEYVAIRKKNPNYTPYDLGLIVSYYAKYGKLAGVDWVIALAQSIHETGWFTSWWAARPRRNPAGIGVSGQTSKVKPKDPQNWFYDGHIWRRGRTFDSWDIAVQNHISLLLCYALEDSEMNDVQRSMSTLATTRYRGAAKQLIGLNGKWSVPGRTYAQKIAEISNALISAAK